MTAATNRKLVLATVFGSLIATQATAFDNQQAEVILASETGHGSHTTMSKDEMTHEVGELMLTSAFARATLPNQPVAGAFLTISNMGAEDDILISVKTSLAGRGEIHEMAMSGDTMKMRPLPDGLVIPAGETVELMPGGYHLMFMGLTEPLVEGESFEVMLEFDKAGMVTVPFSIQGKDAKAMDHSGHGS